MKKEEFSLTSILFILIHTVAAKEDDGVQYRMIGEETIHKIPVGSKLFLECPLHQISTRPGTIMLWKKGHRVLTAGIMKVRRDARLELVGDNLEISGIGVHDGGRYSCEVETDSAEPLAVVHIVEILVPPSVRTEPRSGEITVREGTSVSLECRTNGNPTPGVTWSRDNEPVLPGLERRGSRIELSSGGMILTLHNVDRRHSGKYKCLAHNGVGEDGEGLIKLHVLYSPVVKVAEEVVEGGTGYRRELSCIVHAEPKPEVTWYKNSMLLDLGTRYGIGREGKKYNLIVKKVGVEDFANYSCHAVNSLGRTKGTIQLRGNPCAPVFLNKVLNLGPGSYRVSWETRSYEDILEYRLFYRQDDSSPDDPLHWSTVIINGPQPGADTPLIQQFPLTNLQEGAAYQTKVMARNRFGWSEYSPVFSFITSLRSTDPPEVENGMSKLPETWIYASSSTFNHPMLPLLFSNLFIQLFIRR